MSTKTKTAKQPKKPSGIVWFEIPADNINRAKKFYTTLFGWKIDKFPGMMNVSHIDTAGADGSPNGGLIPRKHPEHRITNYVNVDSVAKFMDKVTKLGGKICLPKTAVPTMGYFAICSDTEGNAFGLWECNDQAK